MQINKHTYGHGEMRNKKLINRGRMTVLQSPRNRLGKERGLKKEKKSYYNTGYSYLVTQPSTNPAQQGLTSLSGENRFLSLWYSNYLLWWSDKRRFPYNCLGLSDEDNSVSRTNNCFQQCYISSFNLLPLRFSLFLNNASGL